MRGFAINLEDLLGTDTSESDDVENARIHPDGQIVRLKEYAAKYNRPNPFSIGDIVTPLVDSNVKGHGEPFIVVDVCEPFHHFNGDSSQNDFGERLDIRTARFVRTKDTEKFVKFWNTSADFEPYQPK